MKQKLPQDQPQPVEREVRKPMPPQQQIAPPPAGPANVPPNAVRPAQQKGEKGKKEHKAEEAPSPTPGQ